MEFEDNQQLVITDAIILQNSTHSVPEQKFYSKSTAYKVPSDVVLPPSQQTQWLDPDSVWQFGSAALDF